MNEIEELRQFLSGQDAFTIARDSYSLQVSETEFTSEEVIDMIISEETRIYFK